MRLNKNIFGKIIFLFSLHITNKIFYIKRSSFVFSYQKILFKTKLMTDKYRYTAAELFKLRMQFKAEVNELRRTYNEVVF